MRGFRWHMLAFVTLNAALSIANAVITAGSKDAYYQSSRVVRKSTADLLLKLGAKPLAESGVQIFELFYKQ